MFCSTARSTMIVPEQWRAFDCSDYFSSALAVHGYYDEEGEYWYIWPSHRVFEDTEKQFLVIGSAGVDGIDWGYRRSEPGLWAWCPIEGEFRWLAPTAEALMQGWHSGEITV
jgi:hypothetical protein